MHKNMIVLRNKFYILIILSFIQLSSCSPVKNETNTNDEDQYLYKGEYLNGKKNGNWCYFFFEENVTIKGSYLEGEKQGKWSINLIDDYKKIIINYKTGKINGDFWTLQCGDTISLERYNNDKKVFGPMIINEKDTIVQNSNIGAEFSFSLFDEIND